MVQDGVPSVDLAGLAYESESDSLRAFLILVPWHLEELDLDLELLGVLLIALEGHEDVFAFLLFDLELIFEEV